MNILHIYAKMYTSILIELVLLFEKGNQLNKYVRRFGQKGYKSLSLVLLEFKYL